MTFALALGGDGGADFGEGGCEVVRGVDEGGACVADGDADELDASPIFLRAVSRGRYLLIFWVYFSWHPRSLQKPTSKRKREQSFLLNAPEDGSAGTPCA